MSSAFLRRSVGLFHLFFVPSTTTFVPIEWGLLDTCMFFFYLKSRGRRGDSRWQFSFSDSHALGSWIILGAASPDFVWPIHSRSEDYT